jgi:integrase
MACSASGCCAQGKDERRPKKRCCALGKCCRDMPSATSIAHIRRVLRTLLSQAITEGHRTTNPATNVKLPSVRSKKRRAWTSDEARQFLESARADKDPFYAAYVLVLVLGLRKGEMLGVTWPGIDLEAAELTVDMQIQRVGKELLHRETKTPTSDDTLPLPEICAVALRERATAQKAAKKEVGEAWQPTDLVFTTRFGTPIEPRNFNRYWDRRCDLAGVRRITIRDARRTCASLLADLDVDPGWPCRSSGTPSSRSPWRSTRWCRRQRPARPSRRWASPLIADMPPAAGVPGNAAGAPVHAEFAGLVLDPVRLPRGDEGRLTQLEAAVDPAGQQKSIGGHGLAHGTSQTRAAVLCCCTTPKTELASTGNPTLTRQNSGPPGTRTLNLRIKSPQLCH